MKAQKFLIDTAKKAELLVQWYKEEDKIELFVDQKPVLSFNNALRLYHGVLFEAFGAIYRVRLFDDKFYIEKNGTPVQEVVRDKNFDLIIKNSIAA